MNELAQAIHELAQAVKQLAPQPVQRNEITLEEAATLLKVHPQTIHSYRRSHWTEGVHYFPQGKGNLYNQELLQDWVRNRSDPKQHQLAIAAWIHKNQPRK